MASLKIGTRGSQLALFQAHAVAELLQSRAGIACDIVVIKTSGDRLAEAPLAEIGGKRLFVKEIEDALLGGTIDLAVHSSKDMPAILPTGLALGAVLPREDARDAVVLPSSGTALPRGEHAPATLENAVLEGVVRHLGQAPRIGTSSVRRVAQLTRLFPGARFGPIRGNLETRLRKLDAGEFDALVLAAAGLIRLGYGLRISAALPADTCVPAPGQGIIAVEIRSDDTVTGDIVRTIGDPIAAAALTAERVVVTRLGGGCQMPIGAYAVASEHELTLTAVVVSVDGTRTARADAKGAITEATIVGEKAADQLLARGAADILSEVDRAQPAVEGRLP
jgi:hydroxymethylbilane synthase